MKGDMAESEQVTALITEAWKAIQDRRATAARLGARTEPPLFVVGVEHGDMLMRDERGWDNTSPLYVSPTGRITLFGQEVLVSERPELSSDSERVWLRTMEGE